MSKETSRRSNANHFERTGLWISLRISLKKKEFCFVWFAIPPSPVFFGRGPGIFFFGTTGGFPAFPLVWNPPASDIRWSSCLKERSPVPQACKRLRERDFILPLFAPTHNKTQNGEMFETRSSTLITWDGAYFNKKTHRYRTISHVTPLV